MLTKAGATVREHVSLFEVAARSDYCKIKKMNVRRRPVEYTSPQEVLHGNNGDVPVSIRYKRGRAYFLYRSLEERTTEVVPPFYLMFSRNPVVVDGVMQPNNPLLQLDPDQEKWKAAAPYLFDLIPKQGSVSQATMVKCHCKLGQLFGEVYWKFPVPYTKGKTLGDYIIREDHKNLDQDGFREAIIALTGILLQ